MQSGKSVVERCFPQDHVILAINPAAMRYAVFREAIFHALVRLICLLGPKVRAMGRRGDALIPLEFSRLQVAAELARAMQPSV